MVWAYSGGFIDDPAMDGKAGESETQLCGQSEEGMGESRKNENAGAGDLKWLLDVEYPSERCSRNAPVVGTVFFLPVGFVQAAAKW